MLPNRTLNLINQWMRYVMTHKLWIVLLELVIQMSYIVTEYFTVNCWQTSDIHKYNKHVCHMFSWMMDLMNFHGQWNMISLDKKRNSLILAWHTLIYFMQKLERFRKCPWQNFFLHITLIRSDKDFAKWMNRKCIIYIYFLWFYLSRSFPNGIC